MDAEEPAVAGAQVPRVPHVGQCFDSWADAEAFLNNYAQSQFFQWSTDSSSSIRNENVKLKGRQQANLYKEDLIHKNVVLTCICGGKKRINNGRGERPRQTTWKLDCPAMVQLIADPESKIKLRIDKFVSDHNHNLNYDFFLSLPKTRRAKFANQQTVSTTKNLFKAGVKPSVIRSVLRSLGCGQIHLRDLSNLRAKWKRDARQGKTPEEKLVETLEKILTSDPGANIVIGKSDDKLEYLFIQTSTMKRNAQNFRKVLIMDNTYKINKNRMPVTVIMVMDGHGNGRSAGYAFLADEKSKTMEQVLTAFSNSIGEGVAKDIKTVIIDKDYSEAKAVLNVIPNIQIQLCDFHVSRTFKKRTKKESAEVIKIVTDLRYCGDEEKFDALVTKLKEEASSDFFSYFEDNWLACPFAWSFRDKKKSANLGNTTTNRVENHNSKIKMMLSYNQELYEALENLLELVENKEEDVFFRNSMELIKESYYMHCTDPTVKKVVNDLTAFCSKLYVWEYSQSVTDSDIDLFKTINGACSCEHWCRYLLPCRHMMQLRRIHGNPVYDPSEIDEMWHKNYELKGERVNNEVGNVVCQIVPPAMVPDKYNDKFTQAMGKFKKLSAIMAECGRQQYMERYNVLEIIENAWSKGREVSVAEKLSEGCPPSKDSQTSCHAREQVEVLERGSCHSSTAVVSSVNSVAPVHLNTSSELVVSVAPTVTVQKFHEQQPNTLTFDLSSPISNVPLVLASSNSIISTSIAPVCDAVEVQTSSTDDRNLTLLFNPPSGPGPLKNYHPECFCATQALRCVANPSSRIAGRAFYKCAKNTCQFWRLAPKGTPLTFPDETSELPVLVPSQCLTVSQDGMGLDLDSNVLCVDDEDSLATLVALIDDMDKQDTLQSHDIADSADFVLVDERNSDDDSSSNTQPVTKTNKDIKSAKNDTTSVIATVLSNIKLPQHVKTRGRPQGLGQTVPDWSRNIKGAGRRQGQGKLKTRGGAQCSRDLLIKVPRDPVMKSSNKDDKSTRLSRGLEISDDDVEVIESNVQWRVRSQTKNVYYDVKRTKLVSTCTACEKVPCIHCYECDCKDHQIRKVSCKHIIKLDDFLTKQVTGAATNVRSYRLSLDNLVSSSAGHQNSVVHNEVEDCSAESDCPACSRGDDPTGAHLCMQCQKAVHVFPECSMPAPGCTEDDEGYGQQRVCFKCFKGMQVAELDIMADESCPKKRGKVEKNMKGKCSVCEKAANPSLSTTCTLCRKKCHVKSECSVLDCSSLDNGVAPREDVRTCRNCICVCCKQPKKPNGVLHFCLCVVCKTESNEMQTCANCKQPTHQNCASVFGSSSAWCHNCLFAKDNGISKEDFDNLNSSEMLSDTIMYLAMKILKQQCPEIGGLQRPIANEESLTRYPVEGEEHTSYSAGSMEPYVQIINSGYDHWLTCYKPKNSLRNIYVLNSSGATEIGSFVEQQLALIMNVPESIGTDFSVTYVYVKQQAEGTNDCGPVAVAMAVELAFTNQVSYVDFDLDQLRRHLLMCLIKKKMEPFPRREVLPFRKLATEVVDVCCTCRLPGHHDSQLIKCSKCHVWCHYRCHGLLQKPQERRWLCKVCRPVL